MGVPVDGEQTAEVAAAYKELVKAEEYATVSKFTIYILFINQFIFFTNPSIYLFIINRD